MIKLQAQPTIGDVRLEQAMTRGERHLSDFGRIPGRDDLSARGRVRIDLIDQLRDLIDGHAASTTSASTSIAMPMASSHVRGMRSDSRPAG